MTGATWRSDPFWWSDEELEADPQRSHADFVAWRQTADAMYADQFAGARASVTRLFETTDDLRTLAEGRAFATDARLITPARYLTGPIMSQDTLQALTDVPKRRRTVTTDEGLVIADVIVLHLDVARAPLLAERRRPSDDERSNAIVAAAAL